MAKKQEKGRSPDSALEIGLGLSAVAAALYFRDEVANAIEDSQIANREAREFEEEEKRKKEKEKKKKPEKSKKEMMADKLYKVPKASRGN